MDKDFKPTCIECQTQRKPMSNFNGKDWICDDCRYENEDDKHVARAIKRTEWSAE